MLLRCLCVRPADFYPRPPRGGRPISLSKSNIWSDISIHALREEGDLFLLPFFAISSPISIHALREEGDDKLSVEELFIQISIHALREEGDAVMW